MNELQRQAYLQALGLTPWVAAQPLPGAAESPLLEWPPQMDAPAPATAPTQPSVADVSSGAAPPPAAAAVTPSLEALKSAPAPAAAPASQTTTAKAAPAADVTRITLQAHQVGDLWLLAEQEDPGAPDFGRDALQLLNNMLAVYRGQRRGARKFLWPLSDVVQDDDALRKTFQSFARGLGGRILLCVSDASCKALLDAPRYQLRNGDPVILPVSSLAEMLQQPLEHKRQSWQAMVAAHFHE